MEKKQHAEKRSLTGEKLTFLTMRIVCFGESVRPGMHSYWVKSFSERTTRILTRSGTCNCNPNVDFFFLKQQKLKNDNLVICPLSFQAKSQCYLSFRWCIQFALEGPTLSCVVSKSRLRAAGGRHLNGKQKRLIFSIKTKAEDFRT